MIAASRNTSALHFYAVLVCMVQKLEHMFDLPRIKAEAEQALRDTNFQNREVKQLLVTCPVSSTDFDFYGTGKIYDSTLKKYTIAQEDFQIFNPRFKGTYLEEVLQRFPYKVGRVRLMSLTQKHSYSLHRDAEARYHIAIDTHPACYLIYKDHPQWYHIPADGHVYRVETHHFHSAMNCSSIVRTHLVFDAMEAYPV